MTIHPEEGKVLHSHIFGQGRSPMTKIDSSSLYGFQPPRIAAHPFVSDEKMHAAMANPLYANDPTFRQSVEDRAAATIQQRRDAEAKAEAAYRSSVLSKLRINRPWNYRRKLPPL
jgi:hypothetical protein